ncbi:hypothetical protein FKM82_024771 [Ascaphus truei]
MKLIQHLHLVCDRSLSRLCVPSEVNRALAYAVSKSASAGPSALMLCPQRACRWRLSSAYCSRCHGCTQDSPSRRSHPQTPICPISVDSCPLS